MGLKVTGRREGPTGANTHYRLDGRIVTRGEAVAMCKRGELPGYHVVEINGVEYLRDDPDKDEKDNIDNQPLI